MAIMVIQALTETGLSSVIQIVRYAAFETTQLYSRAIPTVSH